MRAGPRRDGHRLQGTADQPRPAGRPQGDPVGRVRHAGRAACGSRTRPRRSRSSTIPTSCRSTRSASSRGQRYFSMKLIEGESLDTELGDYADRLRAAARLVATIAGGRPSCPPARHPAPRPQAGQHPARRAGRAPRHRLRPGQADRRRQRADAVRLPDGHAVVHGARAGPGRPRRRARRRPTSTAWARSSTPC